jgi:uncharacterized membrane protein YgdD (TMEM256/DUF423 family)
VNFDYFILAMIWIICIITLLLVVPRSRFREFVAVFLFFQALTWIFSITLTAFGAISTDVRLFERATKISFTSEYAFYPTLAVIFHRWYPDKAGKPRVALHYLIIIGVILLYMYLLGKYTGIMDIVGPGQFIRTFFNFIFEFWLLRRYIVWFMGNLNRHTQHEAEEVKPWK